MKLYPHQRVRALDGKIHVRILEADVYCDALIDSDTCRLPKGVRKCFEQMLWQLNYYFDCKHQELLEAAGDLDDREAINL